MAKDNIIKFPSKAEHNKKYKVIYLNKLILSQNYFNLNLHLKILLSEASSVPPTFSAVATIVFFLGTKL